MGYHSDLTLRTLEKRPPHDNCDCGLCRSILGDAAHVAEAQRAVAPAAPAAVIAQAGTAVRITGGVFAGQSGTLVMDLRGNHQYTLIRLASGSLAQLEADCVTITGSDGTSDTPRA